MLTALRFGCKAGRRAVDRWDGSCRPSLLLLVRSGLPDEHRFVHLRGHVSLEKGQYFLSSLSGARSDPDQMAAILDRIQFRVWNGMSGELGVREGHIPVGTPLQHQR